nr:hypothetical protein [Pleurocapsa sp. MO_226.B13]
NLNRQLLIALKFGAIAQGTSFNNYIFLLSVVILNFFRIFKIQAKIAHQLLKEKEFWIGMRTFPLIALNKYLNFPLVPIAS